MHGEPSGTLRESQNQGKMLKAPPLPTSIKAGSLWIQLLSEYHSPCYHRSVSFSPFHPNQASRQGTSGPNQPPPPHTHTHAAPDSQLGGFFLTSFSGQTSAEEKASLTRQLDFFSSTSFTSSQQQSCQLLTVVLFECKREWRKPLIPQHTHRSLIHGPVVCFLA